MSGNNLVYQRDINSRGEPMAQRSQNGAAFVSVVDPVTGMPSIGATTTSAGVDRSVTTSTTSSQLMAANTARRGLFIANDTAIDVWINFGATAVATAGGGNIKIGANGGRYESGAFTPSTAINIIATSGTPAITAREFIAVAVAVADAPVIGTATAGRESASLTFTPGASNGGYTVQDYLVSAYDSLTNVRFNTFTATASPVTMAPIPAGISAYFKVQARTANGFSTQSGASNAVNILAPFAVPGAPQNVVATLNGTTVTSTYTAPAINGGSAIDVYRSTLYRASDDAQIDSVTGTGPLDHANVPAGIYYTKVGAHNVPAGYGFESPSNIVSVGVTPPVTPVYARWREKMAAVAAGTDYARAGLLGDSTTAGARALGPAANAVRTESPVVYLKDRLNAVQARPTIATSWVGDQSFGVTNTLSPYAYDTRLSNPDGTGWTYTTPSPRTVAGSMLFNPANDTKRLGFLPEVGVDTIDVYYPVNTTLGTFSLSRVGGTTIPVSQVGTNGNAKVTFTGTLNAVDPIYAQRTSVTGSSYIYAMDAYNSAIKSVRLYGMGWSGGKVSDWIVAVNGFDPLPALVSLGLDLVLIRPGINDAVAGTAPATFKTQLATLVDTLIAAGTNVALATHYPSNVASAPQATQDAIAQQVRDVATERGLSVRDTYAEWGTWVAANALGYMADNLHPNKAGYEAEAVGSASFILNIAGAGA